MIVHCGFFVPRGETCPSCGTDPELDALIAAATPASILQQAERRINAAADAAIARIEARQARPPVFSTLDAEPIAVSGPAVMAEGPQDKPATFTARVYDTGTLLATSESPWPLVIDLAGVSADTPIAATLYGDEARPIGRVESVKAAGAALAVAGTITPAAGIDAENVLQAVRNQFPWQCEAQIQPVEIEPVLPDQELALNGRRITGPAAVIRKSKITAVAFVGRDL